MKERKSKENFNGGRGGVGREMVVRSRDERENANGNRVMLDACGPRFVLPRPEK